MLVEDMIESKMKARVAAKQAKDKNQTKTVERKEHLILDLLNEPLCINGGPITRVEQN